MLRGISRLKFRPRFVQRLARPIVGLPRPQLRFLSTQPKPETPESKITEEKAESKSTEEKATQEQKKPVVPSRSFFTFLKDEVRHLKEFMGSNDRTAGGMTKRRLKKGDNVAELLKELKITAQTEANTTTTDVVQVEEKRNVWSVRMESLRNNLLGSSAARATRHVKHAIANSDNAVIGKTRELRQQVTDRLEDWRNMWDTSQHPIVWKIRDLNDMLLGETNVAYAIGELKKMDPNFDLEHCLKDLEEYMIPHVVEAFLKADTALLSLVAEDNAARAFIASLKSRETLGHIWDTRTLDLHSVELREATVINNTPLLVIGFVAQHINCVKDKDGKIVDGHAADIKWAYYSWVIRRDFENPFFDWKLIEFVHHRIEALV